MADIIDSHVHFLAPDRLRYSWTSDHPTLRGAFMPADFRAATAGVAITGIVAVEADVAVGQADDEAQWLSTLRAQEPRLRAIAAHAPLHDPQRCAAALARLAARRDVVAVRDLIQSRPAGWCREPAYIAGVRQAAALGLVIELCVRAPQVGDVLALVAACPEARFVLDHAGKPAIGARIVEPWRAQLRELARSPRVVCKISGLITEAGPAWKPADVLPYARHAADCFGPRRVLYASDWPVLTLAGEYAAWLAVCDELARGWSAADRDRFFRANAVEVYGLDATERTADVAS